MRKKKVVYLFALIAFVWNNLGVDDDLVSRDTLVMDCEYVVLGGGNRSSKLKVSPQVLILQDGAEIVSDLALRV